MHIFDSELLTHCIDTTDVRFHRILHKLNTSRMCVAKHKHLHCNKNNVETRATLSLDIFNHACDFGFLRKDLVI